jgi:hypothetical protein
MKVKMYRVTLDCGHVHVYPVTAHPFGAARLHCRDCREVRTAERTDPE